MPAGQCVPGISFLVLQYTEYWTYSSILEQQKIYIFYKNVNGGYAVTQLVPCCDSLELDLQFPTQTHNGKTTYPTYSPHPSRFCPSHT